MTDSKDITEEKLKQESRDQYERQNYIFMLGLAIGGMEAILMGHGHFPPIGLPRKYDKWKDHKQILIDLKREYVDLYTKEYGKAPESNWL